MPLLIKYFERKPLMVLCFIWKHLVWVCYLDPTQMIKTEIWTCDCALWFRLAFFKNNPWYLDAWWQFCMCKLHINLSFLDLGIFSGSLFWCGMVLFCHLVIKMFICIVWFAPTPLKSCSMWDELELSAFHLYILIKDKVTLKLILPLLSSLWGILWYSCGNLDNS